MDLDRTGLLSGKGEIGHRDGLTDLEMVKLVQSAHRFEDEMIGHHVDLMDPDPEGMDLGRSGHLTEGKTTGPHVLTADAMMARDNLMDPQGRKEDPAMVLGPSVRRSEVVIGQPVRMAKEVLAARAEISTVPETTGLDTIVRRVPLERETLRSESSLLDPMKQNRAMRPNPDRSVHTRLRSSKNRVVAPSKEDPRQADLKAGPRNSSERTRAVVPH
jgi:hypothetical protein